MSASIRSYPERYRTAVIDRRSKSQTGGLGYWAAIDAQRLIAAEKYRADQAQRVTALREVADLMREAS